MHNRPEAMVKRKLPNDSTRFSTHSSARLLITCLVLSLFPALTGRNACAAKEREVPREDFLAGDAIRIVIPADTGSVLKGVYPIDGTGMADLPITGRVVIAGKNRANIEQYLAGIWAPYLKDTHVQAIPVI